MVAIIVTLGLMVAAGFGCLWSRLVAAPLGLTGAAFLWLLVDKPVEGPVLLKLAHGHGLTVADLLCPLVVFLAVARMWTLRKPALHPDRDG